MTGQTSPVSRIFKLLKLERKEISAVYFYAIMNGLILLTIPVGIQALIGFAQTSTASASIVLLIILVVMSVFVAGILQIKQMQITEKIQQKIFVRYSFEIANKIPSLKLTAVDNYYLPELVNRFFDIATLQKSIAKLLLDFPLAIIQIIFGLLLLAFYHPVFIAFGMLLVLVIVAILYFSGSKGLESSLQESAYKYKVAWWLEEMARIIRSVKFSKSHDFHLEKADENITRYLEARTRHFKILQIQFKTLVVFKTLVTTAMLIVGSFLLLNQQLNVGQFIASEIVILTIIGSVEKIIGNLDSVYDVLTAVEKIEKITDKEIEKSGTIALLNNENGLQVALNNVAFKYQDDPSFIFKNISFAVQPNEKVCIRGTEGAGKSTLLRLMAASYDDFVGAIQINEVPIGNYQIRSLRNRIGIMISQQDIFEGTLMENICMGLTDVKMEEIMLLCKKTGLSDFLGELKEGFDTPLNATGRKLPGHAVKKILLIRALIHKPGLLLLEEPWSGLETKHQEQIKKYLLEELTQTTIIVVTSDESFAKSCDKIIALQKDGCEIQLPKKQ